MTDTVPVRFEVRQVEPVRRAGRLMGLAMVALDVAGVELVLQGVQLFRGLTSANRTRACLASSRSGLWVPAVVLPDELGDAIGAEVLRVARGG